MDADRHIISPLYRQAAYRGLAVQVSLAVLCVLLLDGGRASKCCGVAMAAFWCVAVLIAARRPWSPTTGDLRFWQYGFIPCFFLTLLILRTA